MLLLQLPPVQTFLATQVLARVSDKTDHEVSLERVRISWLDRAEFYQVLIKDIEKDTLVYAGKVEVNYRIKDLLRGEYLNVEEIITRHLRLNLVKYDSSSKLNISQFLQALSTGDTAKSESKPLRMDLILLSDLHISLTDHSQKAQPGKLDFSHLDFKIPNFTTEELTVTPDTISGQIVELSAREKNSNFEISQFATKFYLCNTALSIDNLELKTPTSHISDSVEFFFNGLDDFGSFVDSVSFILHFNNSVVSKEDFKTITGIGTLAADIYIDGIIWGTVGDFNVEETRFGYGNSYFIGGISCFGLPDLKHTFVLADLSASRLIPSDLRPHIGDISHNIEQMGRIDFIGSFAGFLNDFVATGVFETDQGSLRTDINIKIPDDPYQMIYYGNIALTDVNVGAFLKNNLVQRVNLKGSINGKGIARSNAVFDLNALVYETGLNGYVYDTIRANGRFSKNFFNGSFSVNDPHCDLSGVAQIDFTQDVEVINVGIDVRNFAAKQLNLTQKEVTTRGKIDLNLENLDLDDFVAELHFDSGLVTLDDKFLILDSIRFHASFEDSIRWLRLNFPGFQSSVNGNFKVSDLIKDLPLVADMYATKLQLGGDTTMSAAEQGSQSEYKLQINARIQDISPYLDSLKLPVSLGGETVIESGFRQSKNVNLSFYAKADTLFFKDHILYKPIIELNGSKALDDPSVLTSFIFQSERQEIKGMPETFDLLLEGVWYNNTIDLTTMVEQPDTESEIRMQSNFKIYEDSIVLKLMPSDIKLLKDVWTFNPTNKVVFDREKTSIFNLEIYDSSESFVIQGVYADSIPTTIEVLVEDLNVNKAELFSNQNVKGFLNGDFRIFRKSAKESFKFDGSFFLKNLQYGTLEVGDVSGSSSWDLSNKSIYTKVNVARKNVNAIQVEGYYFPERKQDQLDFDVKFDAAELIMAEPFLVENFDRIKGTASGALKVTGAVDEPVVNGNFKVKDGGMRVKYLNTYYLFDGQVNFDPKKIRLINFGLVDRKGAYASLTGTVNHQSFKNFILDLSIKADNFEFLNTTSVDNSLYYGSAYGSGTINVTGPLSDLEIKANIKTEPNTRFYLPVSEGTSIGQEDYIQFVNFNDTTTLEEPEESFGISGLTLDFDIEVTPDAYCELIFDIKTGDIIRGRGRGNLKLRLNTDGEFNIFGSLEITEGGYNFTIPNFVNKEFSVVPGSRITWYGDPYDATLDLEATYLQRASFEELDNEEDRDPNKMSQKVPVMVVLDIQGSMLSPSIGFDLRLQNEADATRDNISLLSQIRTDEQELKRQVISLLFLKRFSPRQSFTLAGGGGFGNSVSEFLSSQMSYLISQIDENLEVEVNLADLSNEAFNTFQLRFAYTFLNGRLKVTRGGDFSNPGNQNDNVINDIVGDWSVEYSLTKDGRLRAKVFRNTNQRIRVNDNNQNQETGISLRYVHSFNDLTELLTMKRNEAILRKEEELEENQGAEAEIPKGSDSSE